MKKIFNIEDDGNAISLQLKGTGEDLLVTIIFAMDQNKLARNLILSAAAIHCGMNGNTELKMNINRHLENINGIEENTTL